MKIYLPHKVLMMSVIAFTPNAFLVAVPISKVRSQKSIRTSAPRVEMMRLNHTVFPDDLEAVH